MKAALDTRFVGFAPDASGHALAPNELVYQVEAPKLWSLYSLETVVGVLVRVFFLVVAPFGFVLGLMVRAGWLPS